MRDNVARSVNIEAPGEDGLKAVRARVTKSMQENPDIALEIRANLIMATVGIGTMKGERRAAGVQWLNEILDKVERRKKQG